VNQLPPRRGEWSPSPLPSNESGPFRDNPPSGPDSRSGLVPSADVGSLDIRVPKVGDVTSEVAKVKARAIAQRKGYTGLQRATVRVGRVPNPRSGPAWECVVTFPDAERS